MENTNRSSKTWYKPRLNLSNKIGLAVAVILVLLLVVWILTSQRSMSVIENNEKAVFKERIESIIDFAFSEWMSKQESIALLIADTREIQTLLEAPKNKVAEARAAAMVSGSSIYFLDVESIIIRRSETENDIFIGNQEIARRAEPYTKFGVIAAPANNIYCEIPNRCFLITAIPVMAKKTKKDALMITISDVNGFITNISQTGKIRLSLGQENIPIGQIKLDVPSFKLPKHVTLSVTQLGPTNTSIVKYNIRYLTLVGLVGMVIAIMLIYLIVISKAKQIRLLTEAVNQYRQEGMQKFMRRLVMRKNIFFMDEIDDLHQGLLDMSMEIEKNNMAKAQRIEAELRADNQEKMRVQKERMLSRFSRAAEHERAHLAAELHDDIGQQIVKIRVDASTIKSLSKGRVKTLAKTDDILESCNGLHSAVRNIIDSLHPHEIETLGFEKSIHELVKTWKTRMQTVEFSSKVSKEVEELPMAIKTCLYRCTQEALTNVAKYAQPDHVLVTLDADEKVATLTIQDDGLGFNPSVGKAKGRGLRGMKDRVESLSGVFFLRSAPGKGTYIRAHIPIYQEDTKTMATQLQ